MQSIPPTTADKQTQAQKRRGSRSRKLLGAKASNTCIHAIPPLQDIKEQLYNAGMKYDLLHRQLKSRAAVDAAMPAAAAAGAEAVAEAAPPPLSFAETLALTEFKPVTTAE